MIVRKQLAMVLVAGSLLSSLAYAADEVPATGTPDATSTPTTYSEKAAKAADFVNTPLDFLLNLNLQRVLEFKLNYMPGLSHLDRKSELLLVKMTKAGLSAALAVYLARNEKVQEVAQGTLNRIKRTIGIEVDESCKKSCKKSACKKAVVEDAQEKWAAESN